MGVAVEAYNLKLETHMHGNCDQKQTLHSKYSINFANIQLSRADAQSLEVVCKP